MAIKNGSLYSPSKIYNDYFSRSLALERPDAVSVLSLTPKGIRTAMPARDFNLNANS
jgi:short-subunit dehydrogenase